MMTLACASALTLAALLPARAPPRAAVVRVCALSTAEFSRPHRIDPKRKYERIQIAAAPAECEALCGRFELEGLGGLEANVSLSAVGRQQKVRIRATGSLTGRGVRRKSFSGESVEVSAENVEFEAYFADDADDDDGSLGGEIDMSDETIFDEPIDDGAIDLVRAAPLCSVQTATLRLTLLPSALAGRARRAALIHASDRSRPAGRGHVGHRRRPGNGLLRLRPQLSRRAGGQRRHDWRPPWMVK